MRDMKIIMENFRKLEEFGIPKQDLGGLVEESLPLFQQARDALAELVRIADEAVDMMPGVGGQALPGPASRIELYKRALSTAALTVEEAYEGVNQLADRHLR